MSNSKNTHMQALLTRSRPNNISYVKLSKLFNCTEAYVYSCFTGRKKPSAKFMVKVSKHLHVPIEFIERAFNLDREEELHSKLLKELSLENAE